MTYKATSLRQNLYAILDAVIDKGEVVEIERRGHKLRIVPERKTSIWERLEPHQVVIGDPENLVVGQWEANWNQGNDL
jgi:hypothetical protein